MDNTKIIAKAKWSIFLLFIVAFLTPVIAWLSGFCNVDTMVLSKKDELAKILVTMTFPLTGLMTFIFGKAIKLRKEYDRYIGDEHKHPKFIGYTIMCITSLSTIIASLMTGLTSLYYFKTAILRCGYL